MSNTSSKHHAFSWLNTFRLFSIGFTMGAADIVPGVSGGTVAFLLGIYEELIYTIKLLSGEVLRLFLRGKFKDAFTLIPFKFILPLGLGLLTAILSLSSVITYLLNAYPSFLWSFFFGLVVASVWVVRKRVVTWDLHDYAAALVTSVGTYFLVGSVPVETPETLVMLFLSGVIAICAMILPGISGSFLLVIMGKYEQVLTAVTERNVVSIFVFGMGAIIGLAIFSRVLSYLFAKHHDIIIALLTGFMIGSLRKVWPWKEVVMTRINSHGEVVPLVEKNILPQTIDSGVLLCIGLFIFGVVCVLLLDKFQITKEQVSDVDDETFATTHAKAVKSQKDHRV